VFHTGPSRPDIIFVCAGSYVSGEVS